MIKIGVVGYGYWGPNIVRNFMEAENSVVKAVSDLRPERQKLAKTRYPTLETMTEPDKIFSDSEMCRWHLLILRRTRSPIPTPSLIWSSVKR